jgi:hypothetical protein
MDAKLRAILDRAEKIARSTPPPTYELKRRTYNVATSKKVFDFSKIYPVNDCTG